MLITTGKAFIRELETSGALGVYAPLEGGHEGRYQRRLRANGYKVMPLSARGLGDISAYLFDVHGVRPPHLGKKSTGSGAAVGYRYFAMPIAGYQVDALPDSSKGLVLWLLESYILSRQELQYLASIPQSQPKIKIVAEMGGDRSFKWAPLQDVIQKAS